MLIHLLKIKPVNTEPLLVEFGEGFFSSPVVSENFCLQLCDDAILHPHTYTYRVPAFQGGKTLSQIFLFPQPYYEQNNCFPCL